MDQTYDPAKRAKETQKARERDELSFAAAATGQHPRSVVNLHILAQISHRDVAAATELLDALQRPDTPERVLLPATGLAQCGRYACRSTSTAPQKPLRAAVRAPTQEPPLEHRVGRPQRCVTPAQGFEAVFAKAAAVFESRQAGRR